MNTDKIQLNITLNVKWQKENKTAVSSPRKLLHYYQLPDKSPRHFAGFF